MENNKLISKDVILKQIFSCNSWKSHTNNLNNLIKAINERYYNELKNFNRIKSLQELKENIPLGGFIRYFTYDGEIRYGGILLKKIFIKKNDINDAFIVIKNSKNETWKIYFNNYIVYYAKHHNQNEDIKSLFISYLPQSAIEEINL